MPGVPPDALAQVKRGLKGLFGRKKKAQAQTHPDASSSQQTPSQTTPDVQKPTITTTAPSPSPGQSADQKTRIDDGFPPPPPGPPPNNAGGASTLPSQAQQISEPAAVGEAKNIDLDPSSTTTAVSSAPADTSTTNTTEPTASSNTASQIVTAAAPAASQPTVDHNGMSATSGPLDDSIGMGEYEPGKASVDDADGSKFLEKERDLENDMPIAEDGTPAQGSASVQDGKIEPTATKA
ncbi:MAG: hypothetical protein Q9195_007600 [Heterodermia aff. obscurata]